MNLELGRYSGRRAKWSAFMETCSYMECGLVGEQTPCESLHCRRNIFLSRNIDCRDSPGRRHVGGRGGGLVNRRCHHERSGRTLHLLLLLQQFVPEMILLSFLSLRLLATPRPVFLYTFGNRPRVAIQRERIRCGGRTTEDGQDGVTDEIQGKLLLPLSHARNPSSMTAPKL